MISNLLTWYSLCVCHLSALCPLFVRLFVRAVLVRVCSFSAVVGSFSALCPPRSAHVSFVRSLSAFVGLCQAFLRSSVWGLVRQKNLAAISCGPVLDLVFGCWGRVKVTLILAIVKPLTVVLWLFSLAFILSPSITLFKKQLYAYKNCLGSMLV